jgi:putative transcriptional regulator
VNRSFLLLAKEYIFWKRMVTMNRRSSLVQGCAKVLERRGFSVATANGIRSCFDIVSKNRDRIMFIKVVENIDSITPNEAKALLQLGNFFDGDVFVLSKKRKDSKISGTTQFVRHGVACVSEVGLDQLLDGKRLAKAEPFLKVKYKVDGEGLKKIRKLSGASLRDLSDRLSISKETIHRYEGSGYATYGNLAKLEKFFHKELSDRTGLERAVQAYPHQYKTLSGDLDMRIMLMKTSPFEMLAKMNHRYEMGKEANIRTMKKLAEFYRGLAKVLDDDRQFFASKGGTPKKADIEGIPVLGFRELSRLHNEKELIELILSRTKG